MFIEKSTREQQEDRARDISRAISTLKDYNVKVSFVVEMLGQEVLVEEYLNELKDKISRKILMLLKHRNRLVSIETGEDLPFEDLLEYELRIEDKPTVFMSKLRRRAYSLEMLYEIESKLFDTPCFTIKGNSI